MAGAVNVSLGVGAVRSGARAGTAAILHGLHHDGHEHGLDTRNPVCRDGALIDRRAFYIARFLLDDPVIVLDHPDIAGFVLVDDEFVDLSHPGTDLHHIFGVDDARLIDIRLVLMTSVLS